MTAPRDEPETAPAAGDARARRPTVLAVDDEPLVLSAIRRLLAPEYDVATCLGTRDALARIRGGDRYDAILCDLVMPPPGGARLHAILAEEEPSQASRIVFVTGAIPGSADRTDVAALRNPCLEKPFEPEELRAAIRAVLSG